MSKEYKYHVYILSNQYNNALYIGVTNNLARRVREHKDGAGTQTSFTKKYKINKLVYLEEYSDIRDAIVREKQLKGGSRKQKLELVNQSNPEWKDLYNEIAI